MLKVGDLISELLRHDPNLPVALVTLKDKAGIYKLESTEQIERLFFVRDPVGVPEVDIHKEKAPALFICVEGKPMLFAEGDNEALTTPEENVKGVFPDADGFKEL